MPRKLSELVFDFDKEPTMLTIPRAGRIVRVGRAKAYKLFMNDGLLSFLTESYGPHENYVPRDRLRRYLSGELQKEAI